MNLKELLDWNYLFHPYPLAGFSWPFRIVLLVLFLGAIAVAIFAAMKKKNAPSVSRKGWYKIQVWGWSTGIVGLLLMSFREIRAIYLAARGYLFIWILISFIWLIFIFIYWKKVIPNKAEREKKTEEFNKWIPKKKK